MAEEETAPVITATVQDYYDQNIATVKALTGEIAKCYMPTEEVMTWTEQVIYMLKTDASPMVDKGLDIMYPDSLPARLGTFVVAASETLIVKDRKSDVTQQFLEAEPKLYALVEEITEAIYYACRNEPNALISLDKIQEGQSRKDNIYDLVSLYKLGKEYEEKLEAIDFDMQKLDQALEEHSRLLKLLTASTNTPAELEEKQLIKNKAFTWLLEALHEIDACARYTFGRKSERYAQYKSDYWRRIRTLKKDDTNDPGDTVPEESGESTEE